MNTNTELKEIWKTIENFAELVEKNTELINNNTNLIGSIILKLKEMEEK